MDKNGSPKKKKNLPIRASIKECVFIFVNNSNLWLHCYCFLFDFFNYFVFLLVFSLIFHLELDSIEDSDSKILQHVIKLNKYCQKRH